MAADQEICRHRDQQNTVADERHGAPILLAKYPLTRLPRDLAAAIIGPNNNLIRDLRRRYGTPVVMTRTDSGTRKF